MRINHTFLLVVALHSLLVMGPALAAATEDFESGTFGNWAFTYSTNSAQSGSECPGDWLSEITTSALEGTYSARLYGIADLSCSPYAVRAAIDSTFSPAPVLAFTVKFDAIEGTGGNGGSYFDAGVIDATNTSQAVWYRFSATGGQGGDYQFTVNPGDSLVFVRNVEQDFQTKFGTRFPGNVIVVLRVFADYAETGSGTRTTDVRLDLISLCDFADVTSGPLGDTGQGRGVAWGDYDNDGHVDLYLVNAGANKLFHNDGGATFTDVTSGPLGDTSSGLGAAWGDYDNDGDLDLYLANWYAANKLLRNDGGSFTDATSTPLDDAQRGAGVAWGDYDNDGDLDLYLVNYGDTNKLFRNDGGGVFADATSPPLDDTGQGRGVAWCDYDNDGDLDLYVANFAANKLFRNDGGGFFADVTTGPLGNTDRSQAVAWGDYDNDGDLDLYVANFGASNVLLRNDGAGTFTDVTSSPIDFTGNNTGAAWGDYDNDGDLDLYVVSNTAANALFRNDGGGVFTDATCGVLGDESNGSDAAWGDCDNDGDLDLYLSNYGSANKLFRNEVGAFNHWLQIDLVGVATNASAIGSRVRVVAGGVSQIRDISGGSSQYAQNSLTADFGLGAATLVDTVEALWTSGAVDRLTRVPADLRFGMIETPPYPVVENIEDIPNDQGRQVRIEWDRSSHDMPASPAPIHQYAVYREIDPLLAASAQAPGADAADAALETMPDWALALYAAGWDFVVTVPATTEDSYAVVVPTLRDSTIAEGMYYSTFFVRALTATPGIYFDSASDSGYSVDNLEPSVPESFSVAYNTGSGNQLIWDPSDDPDFQYYRVYRSDDPDFDPTPGDLVDVSATNAWADPDYDGWPVYYKITAVDFSGNESPPASPQSATGIGEQVIPAQFALYPNVPNPFNPTTAIRYDVPASGGAVELRIYDIGGRLVRTLFDGAQTPGKKQVLWDATNANGERVATGVYFYSLRAPGFAQTRKMVLLK